MTDPAPGAVERLWRRHAPALHGFFLRRVDSPHDADDLLQEVFVRAVRAAPAGAGPAWLYTVGRNVLIDHYRRAAQQRETPAGKVPEQPVAPPDEDRAAEISLARCAAWFLRDLPAEQAEALDLVHRQALRQATAAEQAGVSVSGMKSRVQRGRAHLRDLLETCCRITRDTRGRVMGYEPRTDRCGTCRCGC